MDRLFGNRKKTFQGKDGKDCEQFVRWVRNQAFDAGRQDDDKWTAQFAATRIDGPALRWFERLDRQTKYDWSLLSHALLEQYPGYDQARSPALLQLPLSPVSDGPSSARSADSRGRQSARLTLSVPNPTPIYNESPVPSLPETTTTPSASSRRTAREGFIKVSTRGEYDVGYVSEMYNGKSLCYFWPSSSRDEAIRVAAIPVGRRNTFFLQYLGRLGEERHDRADTVCLGVRWGLFPGISDRALRERSWFQAIYTSKRLSGENGGIDPELADAACWQIQEGSGLITPIIVTSGRETSVPAWRADSGSVFIGDLPHDYTVAGHYDVDLIFEPIN